MASVSNPQSLIFSAPYNRVQRQVLTLINPTKWVLLFKLKTNAVQHYSVRPPSGQVQPLSTATVIITLSYFQFQSNICYRHRFSVQSIYRPVNGLRQGESALSIFQRTPRSDIWVASIPVRLEPPPLTPSQLNLVLNVNHGDKEIGNVFKLSDILSKSGDEVEEEPLLKKMPQRKELGLQKQTAKQQEKKQFDPEVLQQRLQKSNHKQRIWLLLFICLILGFHVAGCLIISIIVKCIQYTFKFSNYEQFLNYLNILNFEKFWNYCENSIGSLLKYEKLLDGKNILTVDLLNYLKSCCYENVLKYMDLSNLLTLGAPHKQTFPDNYESMLNFSYVGKV
ncbi:vesicle-associated membrane protein-associated protein B-like isoform X2 [Drosophila obscura]|uniref:vesicle-associated membrane protein-associated protein B-like isoform X2 n=1 Tax=Drosophila obscura TaxID=7282 RepID=UPI001BB25DC4|nr:vesicle-associated membrane protein-associated protein B-like isoform X2 [Drosophila obscura]